MSGRSVEATTTTHPVEVAFLYKGTDLAILVACIGLYERGIIQCTGDKVVLTVEPATALHGHPL